MRDALVAGVRHEIPDVVVSAAQADRLVSIAYLAFPGCEADALLMLLDAAGVQCSTGSACTAGVARPSHVLEAMGVSPGPGSMINRRPSLSCRTMPGADSRD